MAVVSNDEVAFSTGPKRFYRPTSSGRDKHCRNRGDLVAVVFEPSLNSDDRLSKILSRGSAHVHVYKRYCFPIAPPKGPQLSWVGAWCA